MDTRWRDAQWVLYDVVFYGLSELEAFKRIVKIGLTKREAAQLIIDLRKEREV